jgi:hypothetical protein
MGPEVHRQRRRLSSASSNEAAIPLLVIPAVRVREGLYHLFDMLAFDRFEIASTAGLLAGLTGIAVPVPIVQASGMAVPRRANALRCMHRYTPANTQSRQDRKVMIPGIA